MALGAELVISLLSLSRTFSAFKTGGGIEESPAAVFSLPFDPRRALATVSQKCYTWG
jgi:hypothetical protein